MRPCRVATTTQPPETLIAAIWRERGVVVGDMFDDIGADHQIESRGRARSRRCRGRGKSRLRKTAARRRRHRILGNLDAGGLARRDARRAGVASSDPFAAADVEDRRGSRSSVIAQHQAPAMPRHGAIAAHVVPAARPDVRRNPTASAPTPGGLLRRAGVGDDRLHHLRPGLARRYPSRSALPRRARPRGRRLARACARR